MYFLTLPREEGLNHHPQIKSLSLWKADGCNPFVNTSASWSFVPTYLKHSDPSGFVSLL